MSVDFKEFTRKMDKTLEHLGEDFGAVRAGHAAGAEAFRRIANYCRSLGVEYLTVYSKSLELQRVGKQEELPEGSIGLVNDDIILIKLAPGQVSLNRVTHR